MHTARRDDAVQNTVKALFVGSAPERQNELNDLWSRYSPCFEFLSDNGPNGFFVLEGGAFKFVRLNHRAVRAFWLAGFIAWEGYERIHATTNNEGLNLHRFNAMIDSFFAMLAAEDSTTVPMPQDVPEPGLYADADPKLRAPAELATFATSWALLHEIRHIQLQQEGSAAPFDASREEAHAEELSCDAFATTFLLERIDAYADAENVEPQRVHQKRQMGIYFALFTIALIGAEKWAASETHPSLQTRIDNAIDHMDPRCPMADAVACAAFEALRKRWSSAPCPSKVLAKWNCRRA